MDLHCETSIIIFFLSLSLLSSLHDILKKILNLSFGCPFSKCLLV